MNKSPFEHEDDPKDPPVGEQKFTIGDKEYSQEELNDLVGKGNQYNDIETRFNTKLDKVVPDYTRASQEAAELRAKVAAFEKAQLDAKVSNQQQLTPEEIRMKVRQEAQDVGLMTDASAPELIRAEIAGYELRKRTEAITDELDGMGIKADSKIILRYMDAADLEDPKDAADQLYGAQIKLWQQEELNKNKPEGVYAGKGSDAGAFKLPDDVKVNDANLMDLFKQAIGGDE